MQDRLYTDLQGFDIRDTDSLKGCDYLTSIVNETLRLYPPLMTGMRTLLCPLSSFFDNLTGGMRDTGADGLMVGDTFVPGNVTIISPRYSISRCLSSSKPNLLTGMALMSSKWRAASAELVSSYPSDGPRIQNSIHMARRSIRSGSVSRASGTYAQCTLTMLERRPLLCRQGDRVVRSTSCYSRSCHQVPRTSCARRGWYKSFPRPERLRGPNTWTFGTHV